MKKRFLSILLCLCMVATLLPTMSIPAAAADSFANETTGNGQYHLSYRNDYGTLKPEVSGTDNAPVLTFKRNKTNGSGGDITSNYTMDFTRSFNIEGSVAAAERDGVSFALHTTKNKNAFSGSHNTHMMGPNLLQTWSQASTSFTVTSQQNNITNGLLWDFMTYNLGYYTDMRFHKGAYSYQIVNTTTVNARPDDTSGPLGMKNYSSDTLSGDFKLSWQCTDSSSATGNLTLQMGDEITFTYTNLNASSVFGGLPEAKAVYFSFSTAMPTMYSNESITETKIAIDRAYYTDTGDGSSSTLGVETAYYIDTDGNGSYETQLKESTLVGPNQTILCRNKITNKNANATSAFSTALLIPSLKAYVGDSGTPISAIDNQKLYWHEHGEAEVEKIGGTSDMGGGPLNSANQYENYATVTLPAGGNGVSAYDDAYAVYEYAFQLGEGVTRLAQTIQIGVPPFTPAIIDTNVYFNSPAAFEPNAAAGKIMYATDESGAIGYYRVMAKGKSDITLFYDGADVTTEGMAYADASTWLNGAFLESFTATEERALLIYDTATGTPTGTDKIVLASEDEVKNGGTWSMTDTTRATAVESADSTNWWLRTSGSNGEQMAVTQNGTQIVGQDVSSATCGVRPVFRLNLGSVLFVTDKVTAEARVAYTPSSDLSVITAEETPEAYKLTLIDPESTFVVAEDSITVAGWQGGSVTLHYTGAAVGENSYVSAMITDGTGSDVYYGHLEKPTSADGTVTVNIPVELGNGAYTIKVFSETMQPGKATDTASKFQAVKLSLDNKLVGTVTVDGAVEYGVPLTAVVTGSNAWGELSYQWKLNGAGIPSATEQTYTPVSDDIGKTLTCEVSDAGVSGNRRTDSITSDNATVEKKSLTLKADDKNISLGATLPDFTLSISGLVNEDTAEAVVNLAGVTAGVAPEVDGKTAGSFPIKFTGEAQLITNGTDYSALYRLVYADGELQVLIPITTVDIPVTSGAGKTQMSGTVDYDTVSLSTTDTQLKTVIDNAVETGTVTVDVSGFKNISGVKIPSNMVKAMTDSSGVSGLRVSLPTGTVTMDKTALNSVQGSSVTISVAGVNTDLLTAAQKEALGDKLNSAVVVDVNVLVNGKKVSNFNGGKITVSMPYTPKAGEDTSKLTVWYIKDDGTIENVGGYYDANTKSFVFETIHLSQYVLVSDTRTNSFTDVSKGSYYYDAVLWAVEKSVTRGTSATTFSPDMTCTRAQAVTFLWRAMGSPEPTASTCPFTDVSKDAYYYKAVLWATEKGITEGTSETTFSPDMTVSRSQAVTFLWRAAGEPVQAAANPFGDVPSGAYYESAVLWAVAEKITEGTTATVFSPNDGCTRAQIVTFLFRYLGK